MYSWVSLTPEEFQLFKVDYKNAVEKRLEEFESSGYCFNTNYAKYLLQYLENEEKKEKS